MSSLNIQSYSHKFGFAEISTNWLIFGGTIVLTIVTVGISRKVFLWWQGTSEEEIDEDLQERIVSQLYTRGTLCINSKNLRELPPFVQTVLDAQQNVTVNRLWKEEYDAKFENQIITVLHTVDLEGNCFDHNIINDWISNRFSFFQESLVELRLEDNQIEEFPISLKHLNHLKILNLNGNKIQHLPKELFEFDTKDNQYGFLKELEELHLSRNRIKSLPDEIHLFERLEILNLMRNQLTTLPETLIKMKRLKQLNVSNNCINLKTIPDKLKYNERQKNKYNTIRGNIKDIAAEVQSNAESTIENTSFFRVWNCQYTPQQIIPNIYLGCIESAKQAVKTFHKHHNLIITTPTKKNSINNNHINEEVVWDDLPLITHILTLNMNFLVDSKSQVQNSSQHQLSNKVVLIEDSEDSNLLQHFEACIDYIDEGIHHYHTQYANDHGGVLIHCAAGVSRSATIVLAYLMKKLKMSYDEAFDFVYSSRPCISPNAGFIEQLKIWEAIGCQFHGDLYDQYILKAIHRCKDAKESSFTLRYLKIQKIPTPIFELSHITVLNLSHNCIQDVDPSIAQLKQLQKLNLSYNEIKSLPIEISALLQLEELYLNHNKLESGDYLEELALLQNLRIIDVGSNHLLSIPASWSNLINLKHINVHFNKLDRIPSFFESSPNRSRFSWNPSLQNQ